MPAFKRQHRSRSSLYGSQARVPSRRRNLCDPIGIALLDAMQRLLA
jgi:hypothetical protein